METENELVGKQKQPCPVSPTASPVPTGGAGAGSQATPSYCVSQGPAPKPLH